MIDQVKMKALVRTVDGLQMRHEVAVPHPKTGEVLIKVLAFTLAQEEALPLPIGAKGERIVGRGVAGKIIAVGPDVPAWRLGDLVIIDPGLGSKEGTDGLMGVDRDGGACEYIVTTAFDACTVSSALGLETVSLLASYYSLADRVLTWARLYPDESILILGAEQGSGPAAVELAVKKRAKVYAEGQNWSHGSLAALGAEPIATPGDLSGMKVNVIADFRQKCSWKDCLSHLLSDGVYVSYEGDIVRHSADPVSALVDPDIFTTETLEHLARAAELGRITPKAARALSFDEVATRSKDLFVPQQLGPTIVTMPVEGS